MMTKFEGVLLQPLAEQHDTDGYNIDPNGVQFDPERRYEVTNSFDLKDILGYATVRRTEDGTLIATGDAQFPVDMFTEPQKIALAIGVRSDKAEWPKGKGVVKDSVLWVLGATWNHVDPSQPAIRLLDA